MLRSILLALYRFLQRTLVKKAILPLFFSRERLSSSSTWENKSLTPRQDRSQRKVIWYHAASAGELETLWPMVLLSVDQGYALVLTILSESAMRSLERLLGEVSEKGGRVLSSGFSPWEGEWKTALKAMQPDYFVTARYEAWPDLWISLVECNIPLGIVSARSRKSLKIAKWFCTFFKGKLPDLSLFTTHDADRKGLEKLFPEAFKLWVGDPRWDQVHRRRGQNQAKIEELKNLFEGSKRPWGLLGSIWSSDLEGLGPALKRFPGTLWVVPHQVDSENLIHLDHSLSKLGFSTVRTSQMNLEAWEGPGKGRGSPVQKRGVLVDEMGILAELYRIVDWAYVGGGFGAGIHSVIEPCFYGKPICTGPEGIHKFPEVQDLREARQLTLLRNHLDFEKWLKHVEEGALLNQHQWIKGAFSRLGASRKIIEVIEKMI